MTEEEFNLSKEIVKFKKPDDWRNFLYIEDVKEFIKRLKNYLYKNPKLSYVDFTEFIDKLAGKELI